MSLQAEYVKEFPNRKPLNGKGKATKAYEDWLLTKQDPFLQHIYKKEVEATLEQKKEYKNDMQEYQKLVKSHGKKKSDPSVKEIQQMSHPKKVEAFLHPKVK